MPYDFDTPISEQALATVEIGCVQIWAYTVDVHQSVLRVFVERCVEEDYQGNPLRWDRYKQSYPIEDVGPYNELITVNEVEYNRAQGDWFTDLVTTIPDGIKTYYQGIKELLYETLRDMGYFGSGTIS